LVMCLSSITLFCGRTLLRAYQGGGDTTFRIVVARTL
jgi:hypothetical protein